MGSGACAPPAGGSATSPRPASTTGAPARDARIRGARRAPPSTAAAQSRRYDARKGTAPPLAGELRTLAGCVWHTGRRRCGNGIVLAAQTRRAAARGAATRRPPPPSAADPDYLSGRSGTLGRRSALTGARARPRAPTRSPAARRAALAPRRARARRAGACSSSASRGPSTPRARRAVAARADAARATTSTLAPRARRARRRQVGEPQRRARRAPARRRRLAADRRRRRRAPARLPRRVRAARRALRPRARPARPRVRVARRLAVTRRRPGVLARRTRFVEIGPVTAIQRDGLPRAAAVPRPARWAGAWTRTGRRDGRGAGWRSASSTPRRSATCARSPRPTRARRRSPRPRASWPNRPYVTREQAGRDAVRLEGPLRCAVRVVVVAEYYPRAADPVLGVWAHRQALAARDAGADVRVLVLHRPVPPRAALRSRDPRALAAPLRQPLRTELDGLRVDYVPFVAPPRPRSYGSWGAWAAPVAGARAARAAAAVPVRPRARPLRGPGRRRRAARAGRRAGRRLRARRRRAGRRRSARAPAPARCAPGWRTRGSCWRTPRGSRSAAATSGARRTEVVHLGTDLPELAEHRARHARDRRPPRRPQAPRRRAARALAAARQPSRRRATRSSATGRSAARSSAWRGELELDGRVRFRGQLAPDAGARGGAGRRACSCCRASTRRSASPTSRRWPAPCRRSAAAASRARRRSPRPAAGCGSSRPATPRRSRASCARCSTSPTGAASSGEAARATVEAAFTWEQLRARDGRRVRGGADVSDSRPVLFVTNHAPAFRVGAFAALHAARGRRLRARRRRRAPFRRRGRTAMRRCRSPPLRPIQRGGRAAGRIGPLPRGRRGPLGPRRAARRLPRRARRARPVRPLGDDLAPPAHRRARALLPAAAPHLPPRGRDRHLRAARLRLRPREGRARRGRSRRPRASTTRSGAPPRDREPARAVPGHVRRPAGGGEGPPRCSCRPGARQACEHRQRRSSSPATVRCEPGPSPPARSARPDRSRPSKLRSFYAGSDVVVVPSVPTRDFLEPWGLVVNEAFDQGVAVIAIDRSRRSRGRTRPPRADRARRPGRRRGRARRRAAAPARRPGAARAARSGGPRGGRRRATPTPTGRRGMSRALAAAGASRSAKGGC